MRKTWRAALIVAAILSLPMTGQAGSISTVQIVERTTAAAISCLQWRPVGLCIWLKCSLTGCAVETSLKVGHYNPDLVVSAYNELGGNPWQEIRGTLGLAQKKAATGLLGRLLRVPVNSAGNRTEGTTRNRDHQNLVFREADVIGHPLSTLTGVAAAAGMLCPSQVTSFRPYFLSGLDALSWRLGLPELFYPASLIPGLREIGDWPLNTWGNVYPRSGWIIQADEPKAAAVIAQRAGDIVTRTGQPHVYWPVTGGALSGHKVWPPGPLLETDHTTGQWQMLSPQAESSCSVFGSNDIASMSGWGGGRVDPGGDYVWNLWRPYQCCEQRGQVFLVSFDWLAYPP